MGNPARELLELLLAWHVPENQAVTTARAAAGGVEGNTRAVEFWQHIRIGLDRVIAYEEAINELERQGRTVDHYRRILPSIYNCIFVPEVNWGNGQNSSRANVEQATVTALEMAGDAMEGLAPARLRGERLDAVLLHLRAAKDTLDGLPQTLDRENLLWQIDQAIAFAENVDRYGEPAASATAADVVKGLAEYAERADINHETAGRLKGIAREIFINLMGNAITQGAMALSAPGADIVKSLMS